MKRALQLSTFGGPNVSPNPFVGAVIVADGRIIGEGYHRRFGGPHAEVNAVDSVRPADRPLLKEATMYVTLEPCSHFGKTPPCADLVVRTEIPHVVVAAEDPFLKVYESGIGKMRRAGVEVEVGLMRREALFINRRFFTAHTLRRPFVLLKWAQSADGYIAGRDGTPLKFSTPFTQMLMHRERAYYDAIMVGTDTVLRDNPRLDCRLWPVRDGDSRPLKVSFRSRRLCGTSRLESGGCVLKEPSESLPDFLARLYAEHKVTSLMVEGGTRTLDSFLAADLFDEVRIETSPLIVGSGVPAPDPFQAMRASGLELRSTSSCDSNLIQLYTKPL